MQTLSETQQTILNLITDRVEFDGVPPSQAEIAKACGFSGVRAAHYHLDILEQAGFIKRIPGQARGIRLCRVDEDGESRNSSRADASHRDNEVLRLPVLGRVAAGTPIGAGIASDETVLLDRSFFLLRPTTC